MIRTVFSILQSLLFVFCGATGTVMAQTASPSADTVLWHIELLIFKNRYASAVADNLYDMQGEQLPALPASRHPVIADLLAGPPVTDIRPANYNAYLLKESAIKIKMSPELEQLYHIAWIQPDYPAGQAVVVNLFPEQINGLLAGTARVINGKHHQLDIRLHYDLDVTPKSSEYLKTGYDAAVSFISSLTYGSFATSPTQVEAHTTSPTSTQTTQPSPAVDIPTSRVLHIHMTGAVPDDTILYLDHAVLSAIAIIKKDEVPPPVVP